MAKIKLISDLAIGEGDKLKADGLGFNSYANVLGESAAGTPGPFTIGIFGEWGTGKTSLLKMVDQYLSDVYPEEIVTVWFNAWQFEQEEHPIVPLIATIIDELEKHKSFKTKLKKGGKELVKALRAIAYGFSAKSKIKIPGMAEIEASFVAKDMIDREEKLSKDPLLDRSLYYNAFEALTKINISSKIKIVVLVDDLDRCFPDRAIKLLESIKLVLSQAGFIFILAVARKVIEGYLKHRYEEDFGITEFKGQAYLDKIVQLPFPIPPHTKRMGDFSKTLLKQFKAGEKKALSDIIPIIGSECGNNPRSIIRFINNLIIDKEIFSLMPDIDDVKVSLAHFAITRSLQQWWSRIYEMLIGSNEFCQIVAIWSDPEKLRSASVKGDDISDDRAKLFINNENLTKLLFSKYGMEWLEKEDLRVAVTEFLSSQRMEDISPMPQENCDFHLILESGYADWAFRILNYLNTYGYSVKSTEYNIKERRVHVKGKPGDAHVCGFVIGKDFKNSHILDNLMNNAISLYNKEDNRFIYVILLPDASTENIPDQLLSYQLIDLISSNNYKKGLNQIIKRLSTYHK